MIRKLKAAGLALVAVFALGAVLASAASAQVGTLTSTGLVTLIGTQTPAEKPTEKNFISGANTTTTCASAKYTGHKYNVTPHTFIPNDVSTFTVTPHYGVCSTKISAAAFPSTVSMNGCDYVYHLEGTTPGVDTYTIKTTIDNCPTNKHVTIEIFATAAKHTSKEPFCYVSIIESAAGYLGLHATDTTNGKVDVTGTINNISAHRESPTGSILCPTETTNAASLAQDLTLEGKSEGGATTSISLSHL
jgi:hypothetical protein